MKTWSVLFASLLIAVSCTAPGGGSEGVTRRPAPKLPDWAFGPFFKENALNPILKPLKSSTFYCPVRKETVNWEAKDVFNPASVTRNDTVFLLYRAEDTVGKYAGTSRIGLAYSLDGLRFTRLPVPVLYPDEDSQKVYEWEGGCEDPRIVEREEGGYLMTYTAYDGKTARLMVASSPNLRTWTKHGPAFGGKHLNTWSKSGSIVCIRDGNRLLAKKINGKYWMYWGDTNLFVAHSDDLIRWTPVEEKGELLAVMKPRKGYFDSDLVEPGPPALQTQNGIVLLYNSRNSATEGDTTFQANTYAAGQVLFDVKDPTQIRDRGLDAFIWPEKYYEVGGQVNQVVFIEGLSFLGNRAFLYYGTADSKIAVAVWN